MVKHHPIRVVLAASLITALAAATAMAADDAAMPMHHHDMNMTGAPVHAEVPAGPDTRLVVDFPPEFKRQELANMRSHLEALQLITQHLADGNLQAAADVANDRLTRSGMSAHDRHQAHQYMPKAMLEMGASMHRAAGHFAQVAQDAAVSGDTSAALRALAEVESRCVACHRTYRMK